MFIADDEELLAIERPLSPSIPPVVAGSSKHPSQKQLQPTSLEKLLTELRLRVFNKMPIRLLCFKSHGSEFNISLLERGQVYVYLARKLKADFSNDRFLSDTTGYTKFGGDQIWAEQTAIKNWVSRFARYAILSHTWLRGVSGEVTYADWNRGSFDVERPGYQKLLNFCKVAAADHGLTLGWMDTVCINKDSSSELDESIRSMYQWYRDAKICITYLAETWGIVHMHQDPWFTRGWTLQELIAPPRIKFYVADWKQLVEDQPNDKADARIRESIETATTITPTELHTVHNLSISRKMQWAALRQVTREEDIAYCLMGIFGVSTAIAYGEGARRAFFRLVTEILSSSQNIMDIFNWAGNSDNKMVSYLLPPSPASYLHRYSSSSNELILKQPTEPLTLTHLGLRIPVLLVPGVPTKYPNLPYAPIGDYYGVVNIAPTSKHGHSAFLPESPLTPNSDTQKFPLSYNLLDDRVSGTMAHIGPSDSAWRVAFGILNFQLSGEGVVTIPDNCLAIALLYRAELALEGIMAVGSLLRVETQAPIVFQLKKLQRTLDRDAKLLAHHSLRGETLPVEDTVGISVGQLALHGMRLLTVYL